MYKNPFFIENPIGNNSFFWPERENKKIFITNLIKINSFSEIDFGNKEVFFEKDENNNLKGFFGLKNFYEITIKKSEFFKNKKFEEDKIFQGSLQNVNDCRNNFIGQKSLKFFKDYEKKIILLDNHNHAFYFWFRAKENGLLKEENLLIHIDQHSDLRIPEKFLSPEDSKNLQKVFDYTNFHLNVGNYIIPAEKIGFVKEKIMIRSDFEIDENIQKITENNFPNLGKILNLDLDFFAPELDYINYEKKKKIVLESFAIADFVTICTSPYFIDQKLAIKVFKDIFGDFEVK